MMVLRGGARALVFVILGVIAWFVITKFNIPSPRWKDQKLLLYAFFAVLFATYMILEGKRSLRIVSKTKMVKRLFSRGKGPVSPEAEAYARFKKRLDAADEALVALRGGDDGELNTYLFIGPDGSGKTSAILHSGAGAAWLSNKGGVPKAGPTRSIDWYLCGKSVLIDTAGRFVSEEDADAEWGAVLKLLKKRYKSPPITAVVVTVSLVELMHMTAAEADGLARKLRQRLDDVVLRAGVYCPVQLLITHADAVEGAAEFFGHQDSAARDQAWGHSFVAADHESEDLGAAFSDAFLVLIGVLERMRLDALARLTDMTARRRTLLFPAQMAACEEPLFRLVSILSEDGLQQPPPLAGFWLSSSTQQGIVLDRIEDPLAKGLGLAGRSPVRGSPGMGAQHSMFLKEVFTEILPRLGGRSSVSRAEVDRRRTRTLRRYTYCGVFTVLFLSMLFASSFSKITELRRIEALVLEAVPDAETASARRSPRGESVRTAIKIQNGRLAALVLLSERVAHIGASIQGLFSCVQDATKGRLLKSDEYDAAVKAARERHPKLEDREGGISGKLEGRILELLRAAIWYEQIRPSVRRIESDLSSMERLARVIQVDNSAGTLKGKQLELYLSAVQLRNDAYEINAWPGQITAAMKNSGGRGPDPHDIPSEEWDHSELASRLYDVQRRALPPESVDVLTTTARAYRVTLMNLLLSRIPPSDESVRNRYKVDPRAIAKVERALGTVKPETIIYGSLLNTKPENLRQTRAFIQPPVGGMFRSFTQEGCYDFFGDLNDEVTRPTNQSLHGRQPGDDKKVAGLVKNLYRSEYNRRWESWVDAITYGGLNDFREAVDDLEGLYVAQHGGLKDLLSYIGRGELVPEEERPVVLVPGEPAEGEDKAAPPPLLPPIDVVAVCDTFARTWNDAHQLVDETGSLKDELSKVVGDMTELHSRISGVSAAPSDVARNEAALELMSETLRGQGPLWPAHRSSRTMRLSIDSPRIAGIVRSVNGGMVQNIWSLTVNAGTTAVQNDWNVVRDSWARIRDRFPFDARSMQDANVDDVRALLGIDGELKQFIETSMIPLLTDRGGGNYRTPDAPLESGIVPRFDSGASRLIKQIAEINSVVDAIDDRYRVVLTPNKYACKRPGACNDITSMHLDLEGRREIEDYFGQRSPRDFEVGRDSIVTVTSWTGTGARSPCTSRTFEGDWAFWRMMAADAWRAKAAGGREVDLYFPNNEPNTNCGIPVKPGFRYREGANRGPAASFGTLQFKLPEKLFRY
jgi:type VI protein secretion system component VasK